MSILWCGGEDIDFPNGTGTFGHNTAAKRNNYAREGIGNYHATKNNYLQTLAFPGGAVTTAWLSVQISFVGFSTSLTAIGVSLSTTTKGLYIGSGASSATKLTLYKHDGTTLTALAAESGTSLTTFTNTPQKCDIQIANYGASSVINVFLNNVLLITFSGDCTVSGMTNFDSLTMLGAGSTGWNVSEIVVADEDTRPMLGLLTMAPTSTGTTNQFTNNTVTNVNPTTINDANATSTNTAAQDQQYNITDEPAGTFVVKAVKVAARAWITAGATANHIKLGFNSGGSVAVGTSQLATTTATTYEQLWGTNPVTSAAWGNATEINALQVDLQSGT